jgi:hypothetical protein
MRTLGAAGASGANAPRGPSGRRDCAGNDVRLHAATPGVPRANTLGRSSADRGHSDCTAAPARGNARTRTGGRDGRPAAGSSGGLPRHARGALRRRAAPKDTGIHCDHIRFTARCRARRWDLKLPRGRPTPCPPTTRARGTLYRTHQAVLPTKVRGPSGRPPCRAACLTTPLAKNDQVRKRPPRRRSPETASHRRSTKRAVSPPNRRAS